MNGMGRAYPDHSPPVLQYNSEVGLVVGVVGSPCA